jgi:hypothetical protein
MPNPQTLEQLRQYAPKCSVCGELATWELANYTQGEHVITCGPFTWVIVYPPGTPTDPERPPEVEAQQLAFLADRWLDSLRSNPELESFTFEPVAISHRRHQSRLFYCDLDVLMEGLEGRVRPTRLAELVRSCEQGVSSEDGGSPEDKRPPYPTRFERVLEEDA